MEDTMDSLTVDGEARTTLVVALVVHRSALVDAGHVKAAVNQGEGGAVLPQLDLDILWVLHLLSVKPPGDLRLRVTSETSLKFASHPFFDPDLFNLPDELGRLHGGWGEHW